MSQNCSKVTKSSIKSQKKELPTNLTTGKRLNLLKPTTVVVYNLPRQGNLCELKTWSGWVRHHQGSQLRSEVSETMLLQVCKVRRKGLCWTPSHIIYWKEDNINQPLVEHRIAYFVLQEEQSIRQFQSGIFMQALTNEECQFVSVLKRRENYVSCDSGL